MICSSLPIHSQNMPKGRTFCTWWVWYYTSWNPSFVFECVTQMLTWGGKWKHSTHSSQRLYKLSPFSLCCISGLSTSPWWMNFCHSCNFIPWVTGTELYERWSRGYGSRWWNSKLVANLVDRYAVGKCVIYVNGSPRAYPIWEGRGWGGGCKSCLASRATRL